MSPWARIRVAWAGGAITAALEDTPTARALLAALPVKARASTWGDEVYFELPIRAKLEANARQVVEPGTVCFWTDGNALALPFGPTPISDDARPKLASRCNLLGRITGDCRELGKIRPGEMITVTAA